jgi:hypothetical protein
MFQLLAKVPLAARFEKKSMGRPKRNFLWKFARFSSRKGIGRTAGYSLDRRPELLRLAKETKDGGSK